MGAMIARPSTGPLSLLAAVVLIGAGVLLGHGTPDPSRGSPPVLTTATPIARQMSPWRAGDQDRDAVAPSAPRAASALAAPLRVARAYTLAATNWSAVSYRAAYRRQLALASGPLRRQLHAHAPGTAELRQLRVDGATRLGVVLNARRLPRRSPVTARVLLGVAHQRELAGRRTHTRSRYLLHLRHARRWHVVGFTAISGRP
jgi:hypothetical protein